MEVKRQIILRCACVYTCAEAGNTVRMGYQR